MKTTMSEESRDIDGQFASWDTDVEGHGGSWLWSDGWAQAQ